MLLIYIGKIRINLLICSVNTAYGVLTEIASIVKMKGGGVIHENKHSYN